MSAAALTPRLRTALIVATAVMSLAGCGGLAATHSTVSSDMLSATGFQRIHRILETHLGPMSRILAIDVVPTGAAVIYSHDGTEGTIELSATKVVTGKHVRVPTPGSLVGLSTSGAFGTSRLTVIAPPDSGIALSALTAGTPHRVLGAVARLEPGQPLTYREMSLAFDGSWTVTATIDGSVAQFLVGRRALRAQALCGTKQTERCSH